MKILYTGFSARECGDTKRDALRFDMNKPLLDTMAAAGHDIDRRRVEVGETLEPEYDLIVMCLNQALSFNTRHGVLGSLWAAHSACPILMFVNDWQHRSWISHLNTIQRDPKKYLMKRIAGERLFMKETDETTEKYHDALVAGANRITNPWPNNWGAIVPTFSWGNHDMFSETLPMRRDQYACVDFSPYGLASVEPVDNQIGEPESWLLPSLSPQDKWADKQGLEWPVKYLGSRKLKAERVTEQEVLERVALYEGTLSPRYTYLMGSGWWRIRYNYTAMVGAIIAGDPEEAGCLGTAFKHTPRDIELMEPIERVELAAEQQAIMQGSYNGKTASDQHIKAVVNWAASL